MSGGPQSSFTLLEESHLSPLTSGFCLQGQRNQDLLQIKRSIGGYLSPSEEIFEKHQQPECNGQTQITTLKMPDASQS